MRINHTGEVCAQALYLGQALVARDPALAQHLYQAADEERAHLYWCANRLEELRAPTSRLDPLFAVGSFGLGMLAGFCSESIGLGFVVETEEQVSQHLDKHLEIIGESDAQTKMILLQMREDEQKHATEARKRGAIPLPKPIRGLMRCLAKVMTTTTQYI
jgi:ubiquinone biosynthesis monooxygenase Coq7